MYREILRSCIARAKDEPLLAPLLELLDARLALAIKSGEDDLAVLDQSPPFDSDWRGRLARASRDLDLLVAGSRSYGPLGAVLLGAVTRRLVCAAECPFMVVPRSRDAALAVALVGGMEAAVDS